MKFTQKLLWSGSALCLLSLVGCVDDKYDLADIDTTSEFKVKDLVLPINLDPVVLSDIIKVKEGDQLKEVTVNGKTFYAVEQSGEFYSDGVEVGMFKATADVLNNKQATFTVVNPEKSSRRAADQQPYSLNFSLKNAVEEKIEYDATDIDGSIRTLAAINFDPVVLKMTIEPENQQSINAELSQMQLTIPAGLVIKEIIAGNKVYDAASANYQPSGTLTLPSVPMEDNATSIDIVATGLNLNYYDQPFTYDETTNSGSFTLLSDFNIENANLSISGDSEDILAITELNYNVKYNIGELQVTSVEGAIAYNLEGTGLNIEPIDLENLPSFLSDPETNLILANPQIYLNLKNPLGQYGLSYQSSLDIIAFRNESENPFRSPEIKVPGKEGDFNFLLSPAQTSNIPEEYAKNITWLEYENLGKILSGNGLPDKLDIKLIDPEIPEQTVTKPFELGVSLEGMEGTYMFLAPLALGEGSKIFKKIDGWYSDDLADLHINILGINAVASSDVPMQVNIIAYPIEFINDQQIRREDISATVTLPAFAKDVPIELIFNAPADNPITSLDGLEIEVWGASEDNAPLSPEQVITLNNLKAKVTGNYTRKL